MAVHGLNFPQNFLADLFPGNLYEGGKMGEADALTAILVGGHLRDDLRGDVAGGGEAMGLLNKGFTDDGAVLQHVVQVYQVAVMHVLGIIIGVVEMDDPFPIRIHDFLGQEQTARQVAAHFASHVVPLGTLLTTGSLLAFSCLTSSLLHSIRDRIRSSVVLALRTRERL